jgi:hypothetical protein
MRLEIAMDDEKLDGGMSALTDVLCSVCGRQPHPYDDPECIPANKPIAEKLRKAIEMLDERNGLLREAHDAMRAAEPLCDGEVTERFGWLRRRIRTMLAHNAKFTERP